MDILGKNRNVRSDRRRNALNGFISKVSVETLEVRRTPAASIMNLTATGVLSYQAAAGDANNLTIGLDGPGFILFEDTGAGVTIDAAGVPGSVQIAPNKVGVPVTGALSSFLVNLSDMNDSVNLLSDLSGRRITVYGGSGDDYIGLQLSDTKAIVLGEAGDDEIIVGSGGSLVLGGDGDDILVGGSGDDSINGGLGNDQIFGGAGNDTLGELPPQADILPDIYGLLVYTGLDQPFDYVNQLVSFNRDNPAFVNVIGDNGINPELYYGTGMDFDASGNLYMTIQINSDFFYSVDTATGAATLIGGTGVPVGYRVSDLSWDPVGNRMLALVDFRAQTPGPVPPPALYEIDVTTGVATKLTDLAISDNQTVALSVDSQGEYYVLGLFTSRWYRVDRNTYAVTPLDSIPFDPNNWQQGSTVDWARNDVLYYAAFEEIDPTTFLNSFYTVDRATGALSFVSYMGLNVNPNGSTQYADIAVNPLTVQGYLEPGNDIIDGGEGNDTIRAGTGDDSVDGGAGLDLIYGQDGNDTLKGGDGNDHVEGGLGNDQIEGGSGDDKLCGEEGDDVIFGNAGGDTITGGEGADYIDGGTGDDLISGGVDDDTIYGGDGVDSILAGTGDDYVHGGNDADLIFGEEGDDTILGGMGNDLIYGGEGNDRLLGGTEQTANVMHQPRNPNLPLDGNDTIFGGNGLDHVDGGNGDNVLDAGNDGIRETVLGGTGNDVMYSHKYRDRRNYDRSALDGGRNRVLCRGYLVEPIMTLPVDDCGQFTAPMIPITYYTGEWYVHGRVLVEYPQVERLPGNRNGFTPPFRGAQPRIAARTPIRTAAARPRLAAQNRARG